MLCVCVSVIVYAAFNFSLIFFLALYSEEKLKSINKKPNEKYFDNIAHLQKGTKKY